MELVFTHKGRHVCYLFPISCPLRAADRSTGEVLRANIRKNLNIPLLNEVLYAFPLDLPAATADRASANDRCEEARANEIGSPVLRLPCMAHVASTGQGRGFCVIDQTVSGIIASSLAQAPTGSVSELRAAIIDVLRASVLPVRGMPPDPTLAVRVQFRCLLDLCIADDEYGAKRKFLLFIKLTGDINSESILWHTGDTDPSSDEIEDS